MGLGRGPDKFRYIVKGSEVQYKRGSSVGELDNRIERQNTLCLRNRLRQHKHNNFGFLLLGLVLVLELGMGMVLGMEMVLVLVLVLMWGLVGVLGMGMEMELEPHIMRHSREERGHQRK